LKDFNDLKLKLSEKEIEYSKNIDVIKITHNKEIKDLKVKNFFVGLVVSIVSLLVGAGGGAIAYSIIVK
jgi:hypothetical protein